MVRWSQMVLIALAGVAAMGCQRADNEAAADAAAAAPGPAEAAVPHTVLVAGATGRTGRRIVAQLLDRGYLVRAFVRDEVSARERLGGDVDYAVGDVREPETVAAAVAGVDAVISAIGSSGRAQDPSNSPEAVDYGGVRNLVDAAAAAEVSRFVLVSSMGATIEDHPLNQMFDNVLRWKFKGEEHLRASGISYTILRAGGLTEDAGGKLGVKVLAEDVGEGFIPRADVATACIEALQHAAAANKTFSILSDTTPPTNDWAERFAAIPPD